MITTNCGVNEILSHRNTKEFSAGKHLIPLANEKVDDCPIHCLLVKETEE